MGKHWKPVIISPGTLVRTLGTQRFAYYCGGGEVCAVCTVCSVSPRIGRFSVFDCGPQSGGPSTPGLGVAVFFAALAFSLSANSLLTAAPITSALMLYCSRLRQEPCCPLGPNPPSGGAVSKKRSAKRAISVRTTLFLFCRFFVFRYRFLVFFLFVLFDGRPEDYYGFGDCVRG
jgi:hypothetical protein